MAGQKHEVELSGPITHQTDELLGSHLLLPHQVQEADHEISVILGQGARSEEVHLQTTPVCNLDDGLAVGAPELFRGQNESNDDQRVLQFG